MSATIERTIEVQVPIETAYNQWTQFEEFPRCMEGVEEVRQLDDRRLHWVAQFGGERHEWDAEIVEQHPKERVAWRNTDGKDNAGVVTFHKIDDEGLTALTMRRLGAELGVEAMSLYRHVPRKEALLDGIVELIVIEIDVPVDADGDWEDAARFVARSYRLAAQAHPDAFPLVTTRPVKTPEALRRREAVFEVLRRADFDEPTAIVAFRTTAAYVRGFALEEVTGRALGAQANGSEDLLDPRSLASQELPRMAELAPRLLAADREAEFELGLELILTGLRAERSRLRRARRASRRVAPAKPSA